PGHPHAPSMLGEAGALVLLAQRRDACALIPFDACLLGGGLPCFRVPEFLLDLLGIGAWLAQKLLASVVDLSPADLRIVAPSNQRPQPPSVRFCRFKLGFFELVIEAAHFLGPRLIRVDRGKYRIANKDLGRCFACLWFRGHGALLG